MIGKQKHLWQSRRFAKKTRDFRFAGLCALAPLREILYSFTRSELFRISGRQSRWPFTPLFHRSDGKFRFVFWSRPFVFNNSSALFRKSAFAKASHVPSWWRSMDYFPSSNATESARTADFAKPWLRSRFLPAPILCYQSNRWLRFSKVAVSSPQLSVSGVALLLLRAVLPSRYRAPTHRLPTLTQMAVVMVFRIPNLAQWLRIWVRSQEPSFVFNKLLASVP